MKKIYLNPIMEILPFMGLASLCASGDDTLSNDPGSGSGSTPIVPAPKRHTPAF